MTFCNNNLNIANAHGKICPKAPKPLPMKCESDSNITEESHVGLLVICLLEPTLPFETNAIQALVQVLHFLFFFFAIRREIVSVSNGNVRSRRIARRLIGYLFPGANAPVRDQDVSCICTSFSYFV